MFVLEPKSTVRSLAFVQGVMSGCFLVCLIILRIYIANTGIIPEWIDDLNMRHWSVNYITSISGSNNKSNSFLIISIMFYYIFVMSKIGLAIFLWRSSTKDYHRKTRRLLLYWIGFSLMSNLIGFLLLFLLNAYGALEVTLAKIFLIITSLLDLFTIGGVCWLRNFIQYKMAESNGVWSVPCHENYYNNRPQQRGQAQCLGSGSSSGYYNPNHNLRPFSIF